MMVISESEIKPRLPESYEGLGMVESLHGYDQILVRCFDEFTQLSRIKGNMK